MSGPFRPFPAKPPARILLYGDPGTEKTRRALAQLPGPVALIDLEDGSSYYGDLAPEGSGRLLTRSVEEIRAAVTYLGSPDGAKAYRSVIVDPVSVVWAQIQESVRFRLAKAKNQDPADVLFDVGIWSRLNSVHASLLTSLVNLPQHVVLISRGKEHIDGKGAKQGYGPDCHKAVAYTVSTVIESRTGEPDTVIKDRSGAYPEGRQKGRVDLRAIVGASGSHVTRQTTEDEAAARDASGPADPRVGLRGRLAELARAQGGDRVRAAAEGMYPGRRSGDLSAAELAELVRVLEEPVSQPPEPGSEG